jgi:hypothetical protein
LSNCADGETGERNQQLPLPLADLSSSGLQKSAGADVIGRLSAAADAPERSRNAALSRLVPRQGTFGCIFIDACAGLVLAEDSGRIRRLIRGGERRTLTAGECPPLPPPAPRAHFAPEVECRSR